MNILEELNIESLGTKSPEELAEETKIKARVARKLTKETAKNKSSVTAVLHRNKMMKRGVLSNSVVALHKQNLCGGCRLPKQYCRCGRPYAMNEENLSKFEMAFKFGMNVAEACAHVGVSEKTYYEFERSHLEWRELRMEWQTEPERNARKKVVGEIEKDTKVAQWYLEKKKRDEFGRDDDSGGNGPAQVKINLIGMYQIDDLGKVSPQRIQAEVVEEQPFLTDQTPTQNENEETTTVSE